MLDQVWFWNTELLQDLPLAGKEERFFILPGCMLPGGKGGGPGGGAPPACGPAFGGMAIVGGIAGGIDPGGGTGGKPGGGIPAWKIAFTC